MGRGRMSAKINIWTRNMCAMSKSYKDLIYFTAINPSNDFNVNFIKFLFVCCCHCRLELLKFIWVNFEILAWGIVAWQKQAWMYDDNNSAIRCHGKCLISSIALQIFIFPTSSFLSSSKQLSLMPQKKRNSFSVRSKKNNAAQKGESNWFIGALF